MTEARRIGIGVLGCGNVGAALVNLVQNGGDDITRRTGLRFEVRKVGVRSPSKERNVKIDTSLLTDDPSALVSDPEVDVVVELMGGIEPAHSLITKSLKLGKPVITANKELIANFGRELGELASSQNVDLLYEAAVGGGIPLIRPLRESLAGEPITRLMGIVNGTTNYILTRMTEEGIDYGLALAEAQRRGYAESDPTSDVEGFDAAAKAAILANVGFGAQVVAGDVYNEGISAITSEDIALAGRLGYVVKLLAVIQRGPGGLIGVRVHPTMVPSGHPLASVRLSFNALFVEGDAVGQLMFYGRGAGGDPTASAVLGDLIDASHNKLRGIPGRLPNPQKLSVWHIDEQSSPFYLTLDVADHPGVLAAVAAVFGNHDVSIRSMEQEGLGDQARLIFITHTALERDVRSTLHDLRALDAVRHVGNVVRVLAS